MAGQVRVHANVHHVHFHLVEPGQHVDGGSSGKKVEHHLLRHLRGIRAYSFRGDAMIRGEDVDRFADRTGDVSLADGEPLRRQIFQASQAPQRLGECVEVSPSPGPDKLPAGRRSAPITSSMWVAVSVHRASLR
jgi:hypothetical protein